MDQLPQADHTPAGAAPEAVDAAGSPRRKKRRILPRLGLLLLIAWLLPNLVRLNYIQREIAAALSANLGREVRIGDVHPHLVSGWQSGMGVGLGVEVDNVEIVDDPRFGIEPLARIETVEARLALRSLWHARLEFSSIVLRSPSVNLVRDASGEWNLLALPVVAGGAGAAAAGVEPPAQYPDVRIVDGRLNFKLDGRKKLFYLTEMFVEMSAPRSVEQPWQIKFALTPSRTSFEQVPAIVVRGDGQLGPFSGGAIQQAGAPLRLTWQAREALLGEIVAVLSGRNHGTHGLVSANGELSGTTTLMRVTGQAGISDLHRWDMIPQAASMRIPAEFAGVLDWRGDVFQLSKLTLPLQLNDAAAGRVEFSGSVEEISRGPIPRIAARAEQVSLAALRALGEPLAMRLDRSIDLDGLLHGRLDMYGPLEQWLGEVQVGDLRAARAVDPAADSQAADATASASQVRLDPVRVRLEKGVFTAGPVEARFDGGGRVRLSARGSLPERRQELTLRGDAVPLAKLLPWMPEFASLPLRPRDGAVAVNVTVAQSAGESPSYRGRATIGKSHWQLSGIAEELDVSTARVQLNDRSIVLKPVEATLDESALRGTVSVQLGAGGGGAANAVADGSLPEDAPPPLAVVIDLRAERLALGQFARQAPEGPEEQSWLNRWVRGKPARGVEFDLPWNVSGKIVVEHFTTNGLELSALTARGSWDNRRLRVEQFTAELGGGRVSGALDVSLGSGEAAATAAPSSVSTVKPGGKPPAAIDMSLSAEFTRVNLQKLTESFPDFAGEYAGQFSGKLQLAAAGADWAALVHELHGGGEVQAQGLRLNRWQRAAAGDVAAESPLEFSRLTAAFELAGQQVRLTQLAASAPPEPGQRSERKFSGSGSIGLDHSIDLLLEAGGEAGADQRWAGTLSDPRLAEPVPTNRNASLKSR